MYLGCKISSCYDQHNRRILINSNDVYDILFTSLFIIYWSTNTIKLMQSVTFYSRINRNHIIIDGLTVNSVTWIELAIGSNSPASLYISRMKATHDVDFPSAYSQSSCSGIVSNSSKDDPRFSTSTITSGRLRFCMKHKLHQIIRFNE